MEVIIPFVVTDGGGDPRGHALVLAAYGVGSAVASLVTGALPMPRRYLTIMSWMWGLACLPLLVVAVTSSVPAIAVAPAGAARSCLQREAVGVRSVFLVAAVIPLVVAAVAIVARMPADEAAHPLT